MAEAVEAICQQSGQLETEMEERTLQEIFEMVVTHHGRENLPEFWVNWIGWQENWGDGFMGDKPES